MKLTAVELVVGARVAELELDPRFARIRAATCSTSSLPDLELDLQALRVFDTVNRKARAGSTLEGASAGAGGR